MSFIYKFRYHKGCAMQCSDKNIFDCSACLKIFCDCLSEVGHNCQGTIGKTVNLFETCEFCEDRIESIRQLQFIRRELDITTESEQDCYETLVAVNNKIENFVGLYVDHLCTVNTLPSEVPCEPLAVQLECPICINMFEMLFDKENDGIFSQHECYDHSCNFCQTIFKFWNRYAAVSRTCQWFITNEHLKEMKLVKTNIANGIYRKDTSMEEIDRFSEYEYVREELRKRMRSRTTLITLDRELTPVREQINVVVEGSIGSGKSTLLKYLKHLDVTFNKIEFYEEPVKLWVDFNGHNLLKEFYENPKENAFALQSYINLTKAKQFIEHSNKPIRVFERSLASSQECFTPILAKRGLLSSSEVGILKAWSDTITEWFPSKLKIDKVIYLETDPVNCLERVQKRNRSEESSLTFDYLVDLHQAHEDWINKISCYSESRDVQLNVTSVDVSADFESLKPMYRRIYYELRDMAEGK